MAKNFYNLPSPWNPGYAIPQSVLDEGLSRHAYVTAMLPRGTYDNVKTGTAGYAVPKYVVAEGTGRGTYTTKWLPRGYYGPAIPHYLDQQYTKVVPDGVPANGVGQAYRMAHLGDDVGAPVRYAAPDIFGTYGQRAATAVMDRIAGIAPQARSAVLKASLNAIDPGLHARVLSTAQRATTQGVPAGQALHVALATEFKRGLLSELHKVGSSRRAPQPRSLLGLGCYGGRQARGATAQTGPLAAIASALASVTGASQTVGVDGANPPAGLTWVPDATAAGGHWERLKAGQVGVPSPYGAPSGSVVVHASGGAYGAPVEVAQQLLQVGPFAFTPGTRMHLAEISLTSDQRSALAQGIVSTINNMKGATVGRFGVPSTLTTAPLFAQIKAANQVPWLAATAVMPAVLDNIQNGKAPIFRFTNPVDGKDYGLYLTKGSSPTDWIMVSHERGWEGNVFGAIWDGIVALAAAVVKVVGTVLDDLGQIACQTLKTPGAAAGAAVATGGAAAAGVGIAASMCGGSPTMPVPMVAAPSLTTPLLIGGLAIVGIAIMKKHKKKGTTP